MAERGRSRALGLVVVAAALVGVACDEILLPVTPVPRPGADAGAGDSDPDPQMVEIAAGTFMMGCNATLDSACEADESPYHEVSLPAFGIDKTEVTESAYQLCVAAGACTAPPSPAAECRWDPQVFADFPVVCVEHAQAAAYCRYVGKRLPTEAEWERAARGADGRVYPWGNTPPDCALALSSECGTTSVAVGSFAAGATPTGISDLAGNVAEWVSDWYDGTYYQSAAHDDPPGPTTGIGRAIRGGGFFFDRTKLRVSNRGAQAPAEERFSIGFRCAQTGGGI
ncbi:MAG: SUMF1/EgtB/PvdO family nonheme iron enzyme [Deltaproteobacteria bacterium]|nr:SUMF1/EgtB/PvdO family nonheme iron enzyme [Deltaproteobacteria bacterium]